MKKTNAKYFMLLAVGLLAMNTGPLFNHFIPINVDLLDFFKGLGFSLVLASLWLFAKTKRINKLNDPG